MVDTDEGVGRPSPVFTDRRVEQRWDEQKDAGRWFLDTLRDLRPAHSVSGKFPQRVDAMWDTWLLFDRNTTWTDAPGGLLSWGYTIMETRGQLQQDVESLFGGARMPATR